MILQQIEFINWISGFKDIQHIIKSKPENGYYIVTDPGSEPYYKYMLHVKKQ